MEKIKYQTFFSDDDFYHLRKHIKEIYDEAVNYIQNSKEKLTILEVGPSDTVWFDGLDTKWLKDNCKKLGHNYITLDVFGDVDYVGSIENCDFFEDNKFDVVILLSVLEHVENIFGASKEISRITKSGGKVFLETPFLWRIHGPVPDYWRLSEYAYKYLFSENFNIEIDTYPKNEFGKNSYPLSYNVILDKI
jgi:SAM-dependent methyltransferase